MVQAVAEADVAKQLFGALAKVRRNTLRQKRDERIVDGVQIAEQVETLKDETDIVAPVRVAFRGRLPCQ